MIYRFMKIIHMTQMRFVLNSSFMELSSRTLFWSQATRGILFFWSDRSNKILKTRIGQSFLIALCCTYMSRCNGWCCYITFLFGKKMFHILLNAKFGLVVLLWECKTNRSGWVRDNRMCLRNRSTHIPRLKRAKAKRKCLKFGNGRRKAWRWPHVSMW